jgi:hypothetical protein
MRTARASAASTMRASDGSRSQMNDTTQPSHAAVACWLQSSQLMLNAFVVLNVSMEHSMNYPCDSYGCRPPLVSVVWCTRSC